MSFKVECRSVVVMLLVALFIGTGVMLADATVEAQGPIITTRMTSPADGASLIPGQELSVSWEVCRQDQREQDQMGSASRRGRFQSDFSGRSEKERWLQNPFVDD